MKTPNNILLHLLSVILSALFALALQTCTGTAPLAGGTGVGNAAVSGKVLYPDSTPVIGAIVRVRPDEFVEDTLHSPTTTQPGRIINCTTDDTGGFVIDTLAAGWYYIEVINSDTTKGTLYELNYVDTGLIVLEPCVVKPVTKITGTITLSGLPQNAWVQFYGIEKIGKTDSAGRFEIDDLPFGECEKNECEYKLRILTVNNGAVSAVDYELEIEWGPNGIQVEIELDDWANSEN